MTKIFIPSKDFFTTQAIIKGEDAHHLSIVLRKKVGDHFLLGVNNQTFLVEITEIERNQVKVAVVDEIVTNNESPVYTRLFQGLAKGSKLDFVIEKAVELGVNEIIPFTSRYTVVKLTEDKKRSRLQRWTKIAHEAAKQCKRDALPIVQPVITFEELIQQLAQTESDHLRLLAYEKAEDQGLKALANLQPKQVSIVVGAEGGFSEAEVASFSQIGGKIITLGNRILRTETAGIACLAMIQYLWGDLG
ncbi:MAG: 16S rRNA (uracil(1498)-N(3))-methyltransferase [Firmicutes bacterium]|nr:16S rRNA (uracil(1498)-N(3))-methyltransferase [Bacillota bacterium]